MADRAYQACNRDIEATKELVTAALRYVATQQWWTERKFTFGTIFERGNKGQGDYRFLRWAELAPKKSVQALNAQPPLTPAQIEELRRIDAEGGYISNEEAMYIIPGLKINNPNWKNVRFANDEVAA